MTACRQSRMLRLAALGLSHEANTFEPMLVSPEAMVAAGVHRGGELRAEHAGANTTMAGFLAAEDLAGVEVVPLLHTADSAAGPISAVAFTSLADELVTALKKNGPFDGVLAALHGAAVAENCNDVDGYLLPRFREIVGGEVPIGVALDLHANISAEMARNADIMATYRTNPHIDAKQRAEEVAALVIRAARGEIVPTLAFEPVPAVINILCQNTEEAPMRDVLADLELVLTGPDVLTASVAEGYPYADVPEMGMSVVVVTDGDAAGAARQARELAAKVWARREQFACQAVTADEAIRIAAAAKGTPVLLLDVGDNIGGGAPGNSVELLSAARSLGLSSFVTTVVDPAAVGACTEAGIGGALQLAIGAAPAVEAGATVLALANGIYSDSGPTHAGIRHFDSGPTAAVRLDTGQTVVLCSQAQVAASPVQLTSLGLGLAEFRAVVAKGVHSPLAGYGPFVAEAIRVDTRGITQADVTRFDYSLRHRPLFPFEPDAKYRL